MSKIDEIRKRHQDRTQQLARLGPIAQFEATAEQAHQDRATLLAALDGEWQSEMPDPGKWWLSLHPQMRTVVGRQVRSATVDYLGIVHIGRSMRVLGHITDTVFTGAKWQRRTVPRDPFKRGE